MLGCRTLVLSTRVALVVLAISMSAARVSAQTVVDPVIVEFIPSSDHFVFSGDGTPKVQSYSFALYAAGTTKPLQTVNLGKPEPDTDGRIRIPFPTFLKPAPVAGVVYEARVAAVAPSGSSSTTSLSNTFSFSGTCGATLTPISQAFTPSAGSGTVSVRIAVGCPWTAVSSAPWLTITSGGSGSESGSVAFAVEANTSTTTRSATLTIAGQIFSVTQAGVAACAYAISPASMWIAKAGGPGSFAVMTTGGCAWTASSSVSWITLTAGSGTGSGTVTFSVAANTAVGERTGTINVGGRTFTVTQAAGASCSYSVSPISQSIPAVGGTGSVTITTLAGCAWSSFTSTPWITLTGATSGFGTGTLAFTVAPNTTTAQRIGTITLAGQTVSVTQAAATGSCTFTLAPTAQSVPVAGVNSSFAISAAAGCAWTATTSAAWITLTGTATGSGNGTVTFTVAANPLTTSRTGLISAGGQIFTVIQAGTLSSCTYSINPTSQAFGSQGGSNWVTVTAGTGCTWTAVSGRSWITVTGGASGSGSGTVNYSVAANTGGARSGTITIGGQTFTISQAAAACTYSVTPTSVTAPGAGSTGTLTVTVLTGGSCTWGSFSSAPWITVSGGRTGSGTATYTVAPNATTSPRTGTILVAGKTISFTQAATLLPEEN
jgi:hypothetical protein